MPKGTLTPPGYTLPAKPRWGGGWNLRSLLAAVLAATSVCFVATEWVACKLHNPIELGDPWLWIGKFALFHPFAALKLWFRFAGKRRISSDVQSILWTAFAISLGGGLLVAWIAYWFVSIVRDRDSMKNNQDLHGSARWASKREIQDSGLLEADDGVTIGGWRDPETGFLHFLLHNAPESVLLFAPSRSGKQVSNILPTLLQWKNSAFVYDLKGESFDLSAGFRHAIGNRILRFAPSLPSESCCYNPLSEVRFGTDNDVGDATNIAEAVIRNGDDASPYKHFDDAAVDLVTAGILHLGYLKLRQGEMVTLSDILTFYSSPGIDISELLRNMQRETHDPAGEQGEPVMRWRDHFGKLTKTHPYVAEAVQRQLNRADREGSGVQSSIVTPMSIYGDPLVKKTTCRSDFQMADLVYGEHPTTLYFKVPDPDAERLRPLVRLFPTLIFNRLMQKLDDSRFALLLMLDEFPQLKHMPNLAAKLSTMAAYKMRAFLVAQTLKQIHAEYGHDESITSNCDVKIAFAADEENTCRILSDLAGVQTVEKETVNYSGQRTDITLKHIFRSVEQVQRPLITPDEIRRMKVAEREKNDPNGCVVGPGDMLIFKKGLPPIYGTQSLYFLSPELKRRSKIRPPALKNAQEMPTQSRPEFSAADLVTEAFRLAREEGASDASHHHESR